MNRKHNSCSNRQGPIQTLTHSHVQKYKIFTWITCFTLTFSSKGGKVESNHPLCLKIKWRRDQKRVAVEGGWKEKITWKIDHKHYRRTWKCVVEKENKNSRKWRLMIQYQKGKDSVLQQNCWKSKSDMESEKKSDTTSWKKVTRY